MTKPRVSKFFQKTSTENPFGPAWTIGKKEHNFFNESSEKRQASAISFVYLVNTFNQIKTLYYYLLES